MQAKRNLQRAIRISQRFYRAMQANAFLLEFDALRDELAAWSMENPGQLRRQMKLIQVQRDEPSAFATS